MARLWCAVTLAVLIIATTVTADTVWLKGQDEPLSGRIVSRSDTEVRMERFANGKFGEIVSVPNQQIESVVVNFDSERLSRLAPDNPAAYRDYAEELCTQRADAAARPDDCICWPPLIRPTPHKAICDRGRF